MPFCCYQDEMRKIHLYILLLAALFVISSFSPEPIRARMEQADQKVLIFGIDGLTWSKLSTYRKMGLMPNFDRLIRNGSYGRLTSQHPIYSITIWTTLVTGVERYRHGIEYFYRTGSNGTILPLTSLDRKVKALWNIMDMIGEPSGWVSWWASWPAEPIKGFNISNFYIADFGFKEVEESSLFYPPEIGGDLRKLKEIYTPQWGEVEADRAFGDVSMIDKANLRKDYWGNFKYASLNWIFANKKPEYYYNYLRNDFTTDALAIHAGIEMVKKFQPRLAGIYCHGVDDVSHKFWKYDTVAPMFGGGDPHEKIVPPVLDPEDLKLYGKVVSYYYQYMDSQLGEIMRSVDDKTTIVVCSDHGFHYVGKSNYISLNYLLYSLGYLKFNDNLDKIDLKKSLVHDTTVKSWSRNRLIRINVRSNDFKDVDGSPLGAVMAGKDAFDIKKRLMDDFKVLKLKNTGLPLFEEVREPTQKEKNENNNQGDILVKFNSDALDVTFSEDVVLPGGKTIPFDMVVVRGYNSGNHEKYDGVIIISGPLAYKRVRIMGANIFDVTPTILAMLGLPAEKAMRDKGRVLTEGLNPDFIHKFPPSTIVSYGPFKNKLSGEDVKLSQSEAEVRKMLQGLGYLQ